MTIQNDDLATTSQAADQSKEQGELVRSLHRICGLVEAIYAVAETNANENIKTSALGGIHEALSREIDELIEAEEQGKIIAVAGKEAA